MRAPLSLWSMSLMLLVASGCAAPPVASAPAREPIAAAPVARASSDTFEVTEPEARLVTEVPAVRPRLSQTVTLGQGTSEPVYAAAPQQATGSNGGNVIVNNNITVVSPPRVVYGGYGYGYGGYGYGHGRGAAALVQRDPPLTSSSGRRFSTGAWAPTGWEGAQRTAAPGRTPGVGGNWAPAPSHGPATMK